jgi:hypothetical protein
MALPIKIDFNNPKILEGYLEQTIPQLGLEHLIPNLVVGTTGGLAYSLFEKDNLMKYPKNLRSQTLEDFGFVSQYYSAITDYINFAKEKANEFGFGLVFIGGDKLISEKLSNQQSIYMSGIGAGKIEQYSHFERFVKLLIDSESSLSELSKKINQLNTLYSVRYRG